MFVTSPFNFSDWDLFDFLVANPSPAAVAIYLSPVGTALTTWALLRNRHGPDRAML